MHVLNFYFFTFQANSTSKKMTTAKSGANNKKGKTNKAI
jgi:hypothetical protein